MLKLKYIQISFYIYTYIYKGREKKRDPEISRQDGIFFIHNQLLKQAFFFQNRNTFIILSDYKSNNCSLF